METLVVHVGRFSLRFLRAFPLFFGFPILLFMSYSTLLRAVRLALVDFVERSSTKGTVARNGFLCWFFWERVRFQVSPGFLSLFWSSASPFGEEL